MLLDVEQFNYRRFLCTLRVLSQLDMFYWTLFVCFYSYILEMMRVHIRVERIISLDYILHKSFILKKNSNLRFPFLSIYNVTLLFHSLLILLFFI